MENELGREEKKWESEDERVSNKHLKSRDETTKTSISRWVN